MFCAAEQDEVPGPAQRRVGDPKLKLQAALQKPIRSSKRIAGVSVGVKSSFFHFVPNK